MGFVILNSWKCEFSYMLAIKKSHTCWSSVFSLVMICREGKLEALVNILLVDMRECIKWYLQIEIILAFGLEFCSLL